MMRLLDHKAGVIGINYKDGRSVCYVINWAIALWHSRNLTWGILNTSLLKKPLNIRLTTHKVIKIVVNATKGGVGKTTVATNIALLLAQQNKRVWALDLAGRSRMAKFLESTTYFTRSINKIDIRETEPLPDSFPGANNYDFLVADTDDYYEVPVTVVTKKGWRLIVPVVPQYDPVGLEDIVKETASLLNFGLLIDFIPKARIVVNNRFPADNYKQLHSNVHSLLQNASIDEFLSSHWLPFVDLTPLDFTSDELFSRNLLSVLTELNA
jgi:chromosome partitioning protein